VAHRASGDPRWPNTAMRLSLLVLVFLPALLVDAAPGFGGESPRMCPQTLRFDIDDVRAETKGTDCENGGQAELGICAYLNYLESEIRLKAINDAVINELRQVSGLEETTESEIALFQSTQSAWCAYREAACKFDVGPPPYGSSGGEVKGKCSAEYNRTRIRALSRYLERLKGCLAGINSCSGSYFYMYELHPDWNPQ